MPGGSRYDSKLMQPAVTKVWCCVHLEMLWPENHVRPCHWLTALDLCACTSATTFPPSAVSYTLMTPELEFAGKANREGSDVVVSAHNPCNTGMGSAFPAYNVVCLFEKLEHGQQGNICGYKLTCGFDGVSIVLRSFNDSRSCTNAFCSRTATSLQQYYR